MEKILLAFLAVLLSSCAVLADCVEHAVLRDTDYFSSRYSWSNGGRTEIKMWDSPSMVTLVGALTPGALVIVLDRRDKFLKVRAPEDQGGQVGWISQALVELTFQQHVDGSGPECSTEAAVEAGPERSVQSAREREREGKSLQARTVGRSGQRAVE